MIELPIEEINKLTKQTTTDEKRCDKCSYKIILFFIFLVMTGSLSCLLLSSIESNNCIDDNGHKWGKWEIVGRRLLYDNSAVHERTCTKCNFTELE